MNGFTLIEVQIYLVLIGLVALMVCHVALSYQQLYDKTARRAQRSVNLLAAIQKIDQSFDQALARGKRDGNFSLGLFFEKAQIFGMINQHKTLFLDDVTNFSYRLDGQKKIRGSFFSCDYHGKQAVWYRASLLKAFSCSSL